MKLITYTAKPARAEENRQLIRGVFAALKDAKPHGLSYTVLETEDGQFMHLIRTDETGLKTLNAMPAFQAFTADVADRQTAPARRLGVTVVGSYGRETPHG